MIKFSFLFLILASFISTNLFAQFEIKWSPKVSKGGDIASILPVSYTNFYTTRYKRGLLTAPLFLTNHSNFEVLSEKRIKAKLPIGVGRIEQVEIFNEQPHVFISDRRNGEHFLYVQRYDYACQPYGFPVELASNKSVTGWTRSSQYEIYVSKNRAFFCVNYILPGNKTEKDKFSFAVFNANLDLISSGTHELPYESDKVEIAQKHLTDNGDFFISANVYEPNESKKIFKERLYLDKIVLIHVKKDELKQFDLNPKAGKFISNASFTSDSTSYLTFTGLFGEKRSTNTKGLFYFQLDYKNNVFLNEGWEEFDKSILLSDLSKRQQERAEKQIAKGKGDPELSDYVVRAIHPVENGGFVGILEQYFVRVYTTVDSRGMTRQTYYYYYNDLIVYKVNKQGGFEWVKKIDKEQASINDYGYFSSISSFETNGNVVILFNDNLNNYDDDKNYLPDAQYAAGTRRKSNTVALVQIDSKTGKIDRKAYFGRNETEALAVPKKFTVNYSKKELIMVLKLGRNEKYGVLSF